MEFKYTLKNSMVARTLIKPFIDYKRKKDYEDYILSKDSELIKAYKGRYKGKRCFFVGNGPSLKTSDLEKLMCEYTFASNRIFEIFSRTVWRPTYYIAVDNDFIMKNIDELSNADVDQMFLAYDKGVEIDDPNHKIIRIFEYTKFKVNKWNDLTAHISEDVSNYFSVGYTVAFTAIQLAIYMGFTEIYLLGVDFNYSIVRDEKGKISQNENVKDYFSGRKYSSTVLNYNSTLNAYKAAKKYADEHGIKILNATRGGKLEVFDRVTFDSLL